MQRFNSLVIAIALLLVVMAPILADTFVYRVDAPASATIMSGTPGLLLAPDTLDFGDIPTGGLAIRSIVVTNIGDADVSRLFVRSFGLPQGVTLSSLVPPLLPLASGASVTLELWLRAKWLATEGPIDFTVIVEGN